MGPISVPAHTHTKTVLGWSVGRLFEPRSQNLAVEKIFHNDCLTCQFCHHQYPFQQHTISIVSILLHTLWYEGYILPWFYGVPSPTHQPVRVSVTGCENRRFLVLVQTNYSRENSPTITGTGPYFNTIATMLQCLIGLGVVVLSLFCLYKLHPFSQFSLGIGLISRGTLCVLKLCGILP